MERDTYLPGEVIRPKWYTTAEVATMLGYGLTKTKYLVPSGQIRSVKDGRSRTRKTCGSLLAALEVHPRVAMQILRHSKLAITMEIYTEVPSAATREALHKLGQWLDETGT